MRKPASVIVWVRNNFYEWFRLGSTDAVTEAIFDNEDPCSNSEFELQGSAAPGVTVDVDFRCRDRNGSIDRRRSKFNPIKLLRRVT